jgi:inorganic pyrophosphatase
MLHRIVTVTMDRPLGTCHPKHPDMVYPVNYGYVEGIPAPDGDWQDAYVLGITEPVEAFTGELIAVIHRRDDVEDKWVVVPEGLRLTEAEIRRQTLFQERYFDSYIEMR